MPPATTSPNVGEDEITSILDTDLYKLTMQCAILRAYPTAECTYNFTNRTHDLKLTRRGFSWLQTRILALSALSLTPSERAFLEDKCPYLPASYLGYLSSFRFQPESQVRLEFASSGDSETGDLSITIAGKWLETILYEIPLLVLVSAAYFRFSDTDWDYEGQEEKAYQKGTALLNNGCVFSEFGSRRRRSYHTQDLVLKGLLRAFKDYKATNPDGTGSLIGTSNVHFAQRYNLAPIGTIAHEWMMGIAALSGEYKTANETALRDWVATYGSKLSIALTDTFGTPQFLECFGRECELVQPKSRYADFFQGVRQDSGDPTEFVKLMRRFYDGLGIKEKKTIVFSDSLDVDKCLEYKKVADDHGFNVSFGVGTYLTNDFVHRGEEQKGKKSVPLNIVIKISSANGKPAVKISDNIGKNTGDPNEVQRVKKELGYQEKEWEEGDEAFRWGGKN